MDRKVQAYNLLCRWTEKTETLDNPRLAGLLRDAGREAEAGLRLAEREHEEARNVSRRAEPEDYQEKVGA